MEDSMKRLTSFLGVLGLLISMATVGYSAVGEGKETRLKNEESAMEALRLFHSVELTYKAREGNGKYGNIETMFKLAYIDGALSNATGCPAMVETTYNNNCI